MGLILLAPLVLICALAVWIVARSWWIWNGSQRGDEQ